MAHPISVSQACAYIDFLSRMCARKTQSNAFSRVLQALFDHGSNATFAQRRRVSAQQYRGFRVAGFDKNDRKVHLHTTKGSHAVELLKSWRGSEIYRSCQIPVVMYVLGLAHELILDGALTGAANREFLSANYKGLVRQTMTARMLYQVNTARRRELTRTTNHPLKRIGSHKPSSHQTSHRSKETREEPPARGNFQAPACAAFTQYLSRTSYHGNVSVFSRIQ